MLWFAVIYGGFFIGSSWSCYVFPSDVRDPCQDRKCSFGAVCVSSLDGLSARCQCPEKCYNFGNSEGSLPICGTDGVDYENLCEMRRTSCREMKNILKKYEGKCNPCQNVKCPGHQVCKLDASRNPTCRCFSACPNASSPVCASNGKTYLNKCFMELEECKYSQILKVIFSGNCSYGTNTCSGIRCDFYGECRVEIHKKPRCICPEYCEPIVKPVCGSDGKTHDNECELKKFSCIHRRWIKISSVGLCEDNFMEPSGNISQKTCGGQDCLYGSECRMQDGLPACVCPDCAGDVAAEICGSDGISYVNECELRKHNCLKKVEVMQKHRGPCDVQNDCKTSKFGCCPDDDDDDDDDASYEALGPDAAGCPSTCQCNIHGSTSLRCDVTTHRCFCKQGVGGAKCDRCEPTFWGFLKIAQGNSGCLSCNCSKYGSIRSDCDQSTGKCLCHKGFTGQHCQICPNGNPVDNFGCRDLKQGSQAAQCTPNITCNYGGTCTKIGETYGCVCPATCQHRQENGPVCGADGLTYASKCHLEQLSCRFQINVTLAHYGECTTKSLSNWALMFNGRTSYKYKSFSGSREISTIQIEFKTRAMRGLLFLESKSFSASSDFLAILISKGKVKVAYNLGRDLPGALPTLESEKLVTDNNWHVISIERNKRMMQLTVDDEEAQTVYSSPGAETLHSSGFFFIGGTDQTMKGLQKGFSAGFNGCIRHVAINSRTVNLKEESGGNEEIEMKQCSEENHFNNEK